MRKCFYVLSASWFSTMYLAGLLLVHRANFAHELCMTMVEYFIFDIYFNFWCVFWTNFVFFSLLIRHYTTKVASKIRQFKVIMYLSRNARAARNWDCDFLGGWAPSICLACAPLHRIKMDREIISQLAK